MLRQLAERVPRRTTPGIVDCGPHETGANWIVHEIANNGPCVIVFAQYPVLVARLPQRCFVTETPRVTGAKLPSPHRFPEVRIVRDTFEQQVNVIRHHAVRSDLEALAAEDWRYLRRQCRGCIRVSEMRSPPIGANGDQIAVTSAVIEGFRSRRAAGHGIRRCRTIAHLPGSEDPGPRTSFRERLFSRMWVRVFRPGRSARRGATSGSWRSRGPWSSARRDGARSGGP